MSNTERIQKTVAGIVLDPMPEMPKQFVPDLDRNRNPGDEPTVRTAYQKSVAEAFDIGGQKMRFLADQNVVLNHNVGKIMEAVKLTALEAATSRDESAEVHQRLDDLEAAPRKYAGKILGKAATLILVGLVCAVIGALIKKHTGIEIPLVDK